MWQLIETAPKDGTDILIFEDPIIARAYWDTDPKDEGGQVWRMRGVWEYFHATHWMPMLELPKEKKDD